jgi:hypothetical protein
MKIQSTVNPTPVLNYFEWVKVMLEINKIRVGILSNHIAL